MFKIFDYVSGLFKFKDLLQQLVIRDIKLKYRRSFLGYLWSVLNPLGTMIVVALIFSQIFRFEVQNYPAYLICGQVIFNFILESTNAAIVSITGNASLLKKTYVPKYIFTISKVSSSMVNMIFSMIALVLVVMITGVKFTPYSLLSILVILQVYVYALGLGLFLAQVSVFFRDIQYIFGVLTTLWMYCTPIFYPITILPNNIGRIITMFNPLVSYVTQFRELLVYGRLPSMDLIISGILWSIFVLIIGLISFKKNQDEFILYI